MMSTYAVNRERRRGSRICFVLLFLVLMTASQPLGVNAWLFLIPGVAIVASVCVFFVSRRRVRTSSELFEEGLSARLPVWAARNGEAGPPANLRDTLELSGRLRVVNGRLEWSPSARSSRRGAVSVEWDEPEVLGAEVKAVWGVLPMCLLHLGGAHEADIWVVARSSSLNTMLSIVAVE